MTFEFLSNWLRAQFTSSWVPKRWVAASYALGEGIRKNERRSRKWYARASKAGDLTSDYDLALMLLNGDGGSIESAKGKIMLERAATEGEPMAQKVLAYAYEQGLFGFPIDHERYAHWRKLAKLQGMKV
jgi:hypothetical protein